MSEPFDIVDGARLGILMGSASDWPTMRCAVEILQRFDVPCEYQVVSAHRTPDRLREYATTAIERGIQVIIAGAGGAAHLPGMLAAWTVAPAVGETFAHLLHTYVQR